MKFFIIFGLLLFLLYKFSGQIMRFLFRKAGQKLEKEMRKKAEEAVKNAQTQHTQNAQTTSQNVRTETGENVTVSYVKEPKRHAKKDFTDGDYVDFEEV